MPSKGTYLIAFLSVTATLVSLHYFVFRQLRRTIRNDFGVRAPNLIRWAKILFFSMELPYVLLFFRKQLPWELPIVSQVILYPFTVWNFLMIVWGLVLVPQVAIRVARSVVRKLRAPKSEARPIEPYFTLPSLQASSER